MCESSKPSASVRLHITRTKPRLPSAEPRASLCCPGFLPTNMYLQFYINENGDKVYTTKKESPVGMATQSAHPARFSPDDKYSRQRVLLKKRFGLLPTQMPSPKY